MIDFQTNPQRYRHWKLQVDGDTAQLIMDVSEDAGLFPGYQLKPNPYDLRVDIDLPVPISFSARWACAVNVFFYFCSVCVNFFSLVST